MQGYYPKNTIETNEEVQKYVKQRTDVVALVDYKETGSLGEGFQ